MKKNFVANFIRMTTGIYGTCETSEGTTTATSCALFTYKLNVLHGGDVDANLPFFFQCMSY